jgi:hypothetical protein
MSNADKKKTRAERPAKKVPKGDHEVGYCRPDPKFQFKPGNNANPNGRPRGSRNQKVVVKELLLEPIHVREGNTVKTMSKLEAVVTQTINEALKGDHKARMLTIHMATGEGLLTPALEEGIEQSLSERDKMILEDFKRRQGASLSAPATKAPAQPSSVPAEENSPPDAAQSGAAPRPKLTRPVLPINGAYRSAPATEAPAQPSTVPAEENSRPDAAQLVAASLPKLTRPVLPINRPT